MNMAVKPKADTAVGEILKLAIMAVGGQGGGVLTSWIETLARSQGYDAQATSVAGVSQRTGATIYYLEMTPSTGQQPVFALAPSGGDVDVLIAAEMMEVGRSIMRGFVTPDKTTLIGSTHRQLAVSEKSIPGDGIADADEVRAAAEVAAQRLILADMDRLAVEQGSVISASLFGALAGSGALPFTRAAFEDAIRAGGKGWRRRCGPLMLASRPQIKGRMHWRGHLSRMGQRSSDRKRRCATGPRCLNRSRRCPSRCK
ncbi:2-oxoacid:acceptor oxidoreductase family protein [Sulfitobacter aestuariivivens]|uniref:2-oxoacid:acceptor oxidoreductase family protein n=1 Tax=Sulfitobacter aestuariivivens TaxID=2766981 RepID=UPI00360B76C9